MELPKSWNILGASLPREIKYDKVVRKPFTAVDREKLKNACEFLRDLALTEFLYASGLRVSEVASLDRDSINFLTREATVIGKGGKERKFYLSEVATEYLQQYLKSRTDSNQALFVSVKAPFDRLGKEGIEVAEILGHADLRTTQVYVCFEQESVKYHYNKAVA